jgi:hypothetical protein
VTLRAIGLTINDEVVTAVEKPPRAPAPTAMKVGLQLEGEKSVKGRIVPAEATVGDATKTASEVFGVEVEAILDEGERLTPSERFAQSFVWGEGGGSTSSQRLKCNPPRLRLARVSFSATRGRR